MAEFDVRLDDDWKLVRATARGNLSKSQGFELITEARTLAAKAGYDILWDVRQARLQIKLADFFYLPRNVEELQTSPTMSVRVALMVPQADLEKYAFYEDVAANVGLTVKVFLDEDEAITWLTES